MQLKKSKAKKLLTKHKLMHEAAGKIIVKDSIADIFLQQILTRPTEFDVSCNNELKR